MAQISGTTDTYRVGTGGGLREDLEDKIWDLFADENFVSSNLDRVGANAAAHEWEQDTLIAATNVPQLEGNDASFSTITAPIRRQNFCQIWKKQFLVSGTLEAVAKAGRAKEAARQIVKQMRELRNDMEYTIVRNYASTAGGAASARALASMESWIATNETKATTSAGSSTAGYSGGTVAAPTDGSTTGAATEGALKTALGLAWAQGGRVRWILCNTSQKAAIDAFPGQATRFVDVTKGQQASIVGSANVYVSSYGVHQVVLHRHQRGLTISCIDPDYWALAFLRQPFMEQLAKTGDGTKYHLVAEGTLVSRNEAASSKVTACA